MRELSVFEQAILDGLERDYRNLLDAGDEMLVTYLSYFEYAFEVCPEVVRAPAVRMLREAAARRESPEARRKIIECAALIESAPAPPPATVPEPTIVPPPMPELPRCRFTFHDMKPGETYTVIRAFTDFDGQFIEQGRTLTFRSYSFFPYDGGYTVHFDEGAIRMAEVHTENVVVLRALHDYLRLTAPTPPASPSPPPPA